VTHQRPEEAYVDAVNTLASFLALNDLDTERLDEAGRRARGHGVDCVLLAGNSVLHTAEGAFGLVAEGSCPLLLIAGGIGHSTRLLWEAVASHPVYRSIPVDGRPEAHILKDVAELAFGIDPARILIDDASTNCGENAAFARAVLDHSQPSATTLLIVQDPTMQRRMDATCRRAWRDKRDMAFLNWPTFTPAVAAEGIGLRFIGGDKTGLWPMDRFLSLILGEIPRLRDDAAGYGPKGRDFIAHVDIPAPVASAFGELSRFGDERLRDRLSLAG
jgi:uncharacterized SAM-binding protein YcdF (DUF218 family)